MRLTQHRLGIGILAIMAFVMLALAQTANADTSYNDSDDHDQRWSEERKDAQRCDEGYWKPDGSWHAGMDGRSDQGYWGDDGCWRDTPRADEKNHSDDDCWSDKNGSWDYEYKHESRNDDSRYDQKDGRDGNDSKDGRDGKDGYGRDGKDGQRSSYDGRHSSAFSSARSFINAPTAASMQKSGRTARVPGLTAPQSRRHSFFCRSWAARSW